MVWDLSAKSIRNLSGVSITKHVLNPGAANPYHFLHIDVGGDIMHLNTTRDMYSDPSAIYPEALRQLNIDIQLREGMLSGNEEHMGDGFERAEISNINLGEPASASATLPISKDLGVASYLRSILGWLLSGSPNAPTGNDLPDQAGFADPMADVTVGNPYRATVFTSLAELRDNIVH